MIWGRFTTGRARGYDIENEYLRVHGVPVQVLVAGAELEEEAVRHARILDYDGVPVPVAPPEHLVLMYLDAGGAKRRGRAFDLLECGAADALRVSTLAQQFNLYALWQAWQN